MSKRTLENDTPIDEIDHMVAEQNRRDIERKAHAREIVDGRAAKTLEDAAVFAANWIETALQHADNESYYHGERDRLALELAQATAVIARLARDNMQLHEQITLVQDGSSALMLRFQASQHKLRELYAAWPHWECPSCRAFNGEAKVQQEVCRACGEPRPAEVP